MKPFLLFLFMAVTGVTAQTDPPPVEVLQAIPLKMATDKVDKTKDQGNATTSVVESIEAPLVAGVVSRADYSGRVEGGTLLLNSKIKVESFKKGWVCIPLGGVDIAAISEAETGQVILHSTADGYNLLLPEKGVYEVTLQFLIPVLLESERSIARLILPRAAVSKITAIIPGNNLEFVANPAVAFNTRATGAEQTELSFFFGAASEIEISWSKARQSKALAPLIHANCEMVATINADCVATTAEITCSIMRGPVDELHVSLPIDQEVLDVTGADIREWSVMPGKEERQMLVVRPGQSAMEAFAMRILLESPLGTLPADVTVPDLLLENVRKLKGRVRVLAEPQLEVKLKMTEAVTKENVPQAEPDPRSAFKGDFLLSKQPWKITLDVAKRDNLGRTEVSGQLRRPVIKHADLVTTVAVDRAQWTEAIYWVRNTGAQQFVMRLPPDARLLGDIFVGHDSRKPLRSEGSEDLIVPLNREQVQQDDPFPVRLFYQMPGQEPARMTGWKKTLEIIPPLIEDADVLETRHRLYLPEQWDATQFEGALSPTVKECRWLWLRRVSEKIAARFGLGACDENKGKWEDPPAANSEETVPDNFRAPESGQEQVLRRLGPPAKITVHFRSVDITTAAGIISFLVVSLIGLCCSRHGLLPKIFFVILFGVGTALTIRLLNAADARVAYAILMAVAFVFVLWLLFGVLGMFGCLASGGGAKPAADGSVMPAPEGRGSACEPVATPRLTTPPAHIPRSSVPSPRSEPPQVKPVSSGGEVSTKEAKSTFTEGLEFPDVGEVSKK